MIHLHLISGGAGSWLAAKLDMAAHPDVEHRFSFTDTLYEDADAYRFLVEGLAYLLDRKLNWRVPRADEFPDYRVADDVPIDEYAGNPQWRAFLSNLREDTERAMPELTWLVDGRDIWEVFRDVRFLGNSSVDPCSRVLKRQIRDRWIKENFDPADTVITVGIGPDEKHRFNDGEGHGFQPRLAAAGWTASAPLIGTLEGEIGARPYVLRAGLELPRLYAAGYGHNNCFSGDTKYITDEGVRALADDVGRQVRVLGAGGRWKDAEVKSFGRQPIVVLTIRRYGAQKIIRTTASHRWIVRKGRDATVDKLTHQLEAGDAIPAIYGRVEANVRPSAFGIARGITFGDGTKPSGPWNPPASVTLCGDKDHQLLRWFPLSPRREVAEVGIIVCDLPRDWKDKPQLTEAKSVLLGWLAGYFAADGTVSRGEAKLSSARRDNLEFAADVAVRLGIGTGPIRLESRQGLGSEASELFTLPIVLQTLRSDFFLVEAHRSAFEAERMPRRPPDWTVVSVEQTTETEEVYCAVVPDGHAFTLANNVLTGNCGGMCCKAGQGQWRLRYDVQPERYAYDAMMERKLIEYLGGDISMMSDRVGGPTKKPLTLDEFAKRLDANPQMQIEWLPGDTGCGCAIDEAA